MDAASFQNALLHHGKSLHRSKKLGGIMQKNKKVAVVLSGCGFKDGAEIHESVLTMLALDKNGAKYSCFAPDFPQYRVVDHYNDKESSEKRNILAESARIARGDIKPLSKFNAEDFDAIVFPGGFGAALNLSTFAQEGAKCVVHKDVEKAVIDMHKKGKPIAALCIAPVIIARLIKGAEITIGNDAGTASVLETMGASHQNTKHGEIVIDKERKIVTTPCYMLESSISQIYEGVDNLVKALLKMMAS
jgi:enhancing lycopene biosynthesis protein 2